MTINEFASGCIDLFGDMMRGLISLLIDAAMIYFFIDYTKKGSVFASCFVGLIVLKIIINRASEAWYESD